MSKELNYQEVVQWLENVIPAIDCVEGKRGDVFVLSWLSSKSDPTGKAVGQRTVSGNSIKQAVESAVALYGNQP